MLDELGINDIPAFYRETTSYTSDCIARKTVYNFKLIDQECHYPRQSSGRRFPPACRKCCQDLSGLQIESLSRYGRPEAYADHQCASATCCWKHGSRLLAIGIRVFQTTTKYRSSNIPVSNTSQYLAQFIHTLARFDLDIGRETTIQTIKRLVLQDGQDKRKRAFLLSSKGSSKSFRMMCSTITGSTPVSRIHGNTL